MFCIALFSLQIYLIYYICQYLENIYKIRVMEERSKYAKSNQTFTINFSLQTTMQKIITRFKNKFHSNQGNKKSKKA